jgi:hypothetical protein
MGPTSLVATGLGWPECPRWHDGQLWFTDMHQRAVFRVTSAGTERVCDVPAIPGGLGWLPDGSLVIVAMTERRLLRYAGGSLSPYADLAGLIDDTANDLVVDDEGRCYVSNLGGAYPAMRAGTVPAKVPLVMVSPDGTAVRLQASAVECRLSWPQDGPTPVACALGGQDRTELFVCLGDVGPALDGEAVPAGGPLRGRIESVPVSAAVSGGN